MGRMHDALKKAEEEREARRRRPESEAPQGESASPPRNDAPPPRLRPVDATRPVRTPIFADLSIPVEPKGKRPKRGLAAGLLRRSADGGDVSRDSRYSEHLLVWHSPTDPRTEQFRNIRTNLHALDPQPVVLEVVSAVEAEGSDVTCANLGIAFAEDGSAKILLVDADLRSPMLHSHFGLSRDLPGLADVLSGRLGPEEVIVETGIPNVYFVPAGARVPNPGGLLSSPRMREAIQSWRGAFSRVFVDTPAATAVGDAAVIGRHVDGALVVIKLGSTPRKSTERALETLASSGTRVIGCILTHSEDKADAVLDDETRSPP